MIEVNILQSLQQLVCNQNQLYVAYSGGLDSSVLLHILAQSNLKERVSALHVHHGVSKNADSWVLHCKKVCKRLNVELHIKHVVLDANKGIGFEAAAREARLNFFKSFLSSGDALVTGHHLNDQIETFIYRLIRGAGLQGLSGMKASRKLGLGKMLRPMLTFKREELQAYALANNIDWVEDDSNVDTRFDRNYIRNVIVPSISSRWPKAASTIASSIKNVQDEKRLLNDYLDQDLINLSRRSEKVGESLCLNALKVQPTPKVQALIHRWCESLNVCSPEKKQLLELSSLIAAKDEAQPCLRWGENQFRRHKGRLYLIPVLGPAPTEVLDWNMSQDIDLGQGFQLHLITSPELTNHFLALDARLRFDKAGIRCKPISRGRSQTLKKLLQEYGVEPWLRPFVPLIYVNDYLVAVGDYWLCESTPELQSAQFSWSYTPAERLL